MLEEYAASDGEGDVVVSVDNGGREIISLICIVLVARCIGIEISRRLALLLLAGIAVNIGVSASAQGSQAPRFYVDLPDTEIWYQRELTVAGWIWAGQDDPITKVLLESGDWSHVIPLGLERNDVAAALENPAAASAGFLGDVELPESGLADGTFKIVAYRASGTPVLLKTISYEPSEISKRWASWLQRYPQWKNDVFWFAPGASGVSSGSDQSFKLAYEDYQSDTLRIGLRVPVLYMRTTEGREGDWRFDPEPEPIKLPNGRWVADDWLQGLMDLAVTKQLPILFTLNGGVWGDAYSAGPDHDLIDYLELDPMNCQWDQNDQVYPDGARNDLPGSLPSPELHRMLTLNAMNKTVRAYKSRNLKAAGKLLAEFARNYPDLFIGINLDADLYLSPFVKGSWHDFNPDTLEQFRQWLSGSGLYSEGALLSDYRQQSMTLEEVNDVSGMQFGIWPEVEPPRTVPAQFLPDETSDPWMVLWEQFRRHLVDLHYDDMSRWLVESGVSGDKIFSSQAFIESRRWVQPFAERLDSPMKNFDSAGVTVEGGKPEHGHLGAILYGKSAINAIATESGRSLFRVFYDLDPDWGMVEHNTADFRDPPKQIPDYAQGYQSMRELFNYHGQLISPMAWNGNHGEWVDEPGFHAHTAYRLTPMEKAVEDFMREYAYLPRRALYWPFGNRRHDNADGWTAESPNTILWPEQGKLRWHHPAGISSLLSPEDLALDPGVHRTLVVSPNRKGRLRSIGVDYEDRNIPDAGWQEAHPMTPVSQLEIDDSGVALPLSWTAGSQPSRIRLRFDMRSKGESSFEHVAILPTGAKPLP